MLIDLQFAASRHRSPLPSAQQLEHWAAVALGDERPGAEMTLRLVDPEEIQALNRQYRGQDKPTNVLSFPADLPEALGLPLLGDVLICAEVVEREAEEQGKLLEAHWAHMVIHGTLHLLGYDHIEEDAAREMENLETQLITGLGYEDPYETV